MNILFVIPKTFATYTGAVVPHLGVAYLVAVLKQHKVATRIIDMGLGYTNQDLVDAIREYRPQLIGLTAYTFGFNETKQLIDVINQHKECPVVIGGPHVSAYKTEVFNQVDVDFAIKGEGEYALLELSKSLEKHKQEFGHIENLLWRKGEQVVKNFDAPLIKDLDALPFPDFEAFELDRYVFSVDRRLPIATSRGCPYKCNFCTVKLSMGTPFRRRSPENVVNEMNILYEKGWRYFDIVDDVFTMDMKRAKKICDLIIDRKLAINWSLGNGIRADRVDEELLSAMKKAGCVFLIYGLESGDDQILEVIKKGITVDRAMQAFELTKKVGIEFAVNFIIGHPTETYETAMKTLKLAAAMPSDYVNVYNLLPYPGTALYEWVKENGRFLVNEEDYLYSIATRVKKPIFETKEFTAVERQKALDKGFALSRRSHLKYRFGLLFASIMWRPVANSEKLYLLGRRVIFGSKLGRRTFNAVKRGH